VHRPLDEHFAVVYDVGAAAVRCSCGTYRHSNVGDGHASRVTELLLRKSRQNALHRRI